MIIEEALWIRRIIDLLGPESILNCGSSTLEFRRRQQPFINDLLFQRLSNVTHLDAKLGNGIDVVADLGDQRLRASAKYEMVLLTSVLEHVERRDIVLRNTCEFARRYLVVSVPRRWRYHPDPIDTMYRPSVEELEELIASHGFGMMQSEELVDSKGRGSMAIVAACR